MHSDGFKVKKTGAEKAANFFDGVGGEELIALHENYDSFMGDIELNTLQTLAFRRQIGVLVKEGFACDRDPPAMNSAASGKDTVENTQCTTNGNIIVNR